ncbi:MAG: protein kinase domain-containing protein [Bacilli bacterium]
MSVSRRPYAPLPEFQPGTVLPGKWRGRQYRIMRLVGRGANGAVYQVLRERSLVAIKIGENATAIALEYERMRELTASIGIPGIIPELYEHDDVEHGGEVYPMLAMEFIRGVSPEEFVGVHGRKWIPVCLGRLLRRLETLHARGYAFCDLKSANLIFDQDTAEARLVDFGGLTPIGQAVREFTELYDRAWWGLGTRKADPHYDMFACALLGLQLIAPINPADLDRLRTRRPAEREAFLYRRCASEINDGQQQLRAILSMALKGQYREPAEFRMALDSLLVPLQGERRAPAEHAGRSTTPGPDGVLKRARPRRRWDLTDWGLLVAVTVFVAVMGTLLWLGSL